MSPPRAAIAATLYAVGVALAAAALALAATGLRPEAPKRADRLALPDGPPPSADCPPETAR